ncbi:MAG TPA: RdgB/HAM1 family non-canonical purine NTP pyrophosphatase [Actinomycetaceae bacterium]|nr:RdgB/HAM1 family non-canonical purine NTP pyrophosphatase [Actinomycetaceae bacterium]
MRNLPGHARLVLASANPKKVEELRAILRKAIPGFREETVVGLKDVGMPSPIEDGVTFEENSVLKARAVAQATGLPAVADDSGIIVDVLGKAPGVFSARWAGSHGDDVANLELLLDQLADVPDHHRHARFVCAATLVTPDGASHTETGEVEGVLLRSPRGENGFGYDPIFQPHGYSRSMAELTPSEKHAISHRGKALRGLTDEIAAAVSRPV